MNGLNSFNDPGDLIGLDGQIKSGILAIGIFASLSTVAASTLIIFISYRLVAWRRYYHEFLGYNQCVVLIFNLLLADLFQASALVISLHWYGMDAIMSNTPVCWVQAGLLQLGDVASAFFVLAIAAQTVYQVGFNKRLRYHTFCATVVVIWLAALLLAIAAPLRFGAHFFARAGNWCWISASYDSERLWLHYLWVFCVEFGTIVVYIGLLIYITRRVQVLRQEESSAIQHQKIVRAARYMICYPLGYVIFTLPLATGRMIALSGGSVTSSYLAAAGCLLASCGWFDTLVYTLTRRVLLKADPGLAFSSEGQDAEVENHEEDSGGTTSSMESACNPKSSGIGSADEYRLENVTVKAGDGRLSGNTVTNLIEAPSAAVLPTIWGDVTPEYGSSTRISEEDAYSQTPVMAKRLSVGASRRHSRCSSP